MEVLAIKSVMFDEEEVPLSNEKTIECMVVDKKKQDILSK
jgi:hypothetical protein